MKKKNVKKAIEEIIKQTFVPASIVFLFILVSVTFNREAVRPDGYHMKKMVVITLFTMIIMIASVVIIFLQKKRTKYEKLVDEIKKNKVFISLFLVMILVRIPLLNMLQRWDAGEYYFRFSGAVSEFTYSGFDEYADLFALCGHRTLAFSFIYMIGEMIFPQRIIGVSLVSLILTACSMICMYKILIRIFSNITETRAAIYAFIIFMNPLLYCTTSYFNPDYAMCMFLIFTLYGIVYDKPVTVGIFSAICLQTKETGVVLIGGLAFGIILMHMVENKGIEKIKKIFGDLRLYMILAASVMLLWYNRYTGGIQWSQNAEQSAGLRWDNNGEDCFGINLEYIYTKFSQIFLLNFNWIIIVLTIVAVVLLIIKRDKYKKNNTGYIIPVVFSFVSILLFDFLYMTSSAVRYNISEHVLVYFIAIYIYESIQKNICSNNRGKLIMCVTSIAAVLCIAIESFVTVDPVTRMVFRKLDNGGNGIYFMGTNVDKEKMYYGDYLIYNTQYMYIDRAYDKILRNVNYTPDSTDIIVASTNGTFVCGNLPLYYLNWDLKNEKRVFYSNENTETMLFYHEIISNKEFHVNANQELKDKAILIVNPYWLNVNSQDVLNTLKKWYYIGSLNEQSELGGKIYYYEMTLK